MSFFGSRLRRVEASVASRTEVRCRACGLRPQDKGYIVVKDEGTYKDPVPELPKVCPECGRNTRLYIEVVYEGEGP